MPEITLEVGGPGPGQRSGSRTGFQLTLRPLLSPAGAQGPSLPRTVCLGRAGPDPRARVGDEEVCLLFLPSPLFLSLPLVALSSLLSLLFGCVCRARSPGDTGSSEMQPLSPNTSQIHGGERISGQTAKWMRQAGCCRAGEGGRWAGRQAALGSQARRALLSFRGAGFLQPGPTSEERSPRSELSEASGSPQPCQVPLLSWARAQAGAPPGPVCVCCPGSVSAGPPLALSAEDALRPCTEGGRAEGRQGGEPAGASTCSAWTWPAHLGLLTAALGRRRPPPPPVTAAPSAPAQVVGEPHYLEVPVGAMAS